MARKHHKPEEIVAKLRQVEVLVGQGKPVAEGVRAIGVTRNVSTTLIQPVLEFRLGWSGRLCGIELSEAAGFLV